MSATAQEIQQGETCEAVNGIVQTLQIWQPNTGVHRTFVCSEQAILASLPQQQREKFDFGRLLENCRLLQIDLNVAKRNLSYVIALVSPAHGLRLPYMAVFLPDDQTQESTPHWDVVRSLLSTYGIVKVTRMPPADACPTGQVVSWDFAKMRGVHPQH